MSKKLTWQEAAKHMIDGQICLDGDSTEWRFSLGIFQYRPKNFVNWNPFDITTRKGDTFTIKQQPVKYSVDVWLSEKPNKNGGPTIVTHLLGDSFTSWGKKPLEEDENFYKQYKITVEEVTDGN